MKRSIDLQAALLLLSVVVSCLWQTATVDGFQSPPPVRRRKNSIDFGFRSNGLSRILVSERYAKAAEPVILEKLEASEEDESAGSSSASVTLTVGTETASSSTETNVLGLSQETIGLLVLATVPVVWGSYVPVVRALYEIDPPIPGFVFSTAYFAVASVSSFSLLNLQEGRRRLDDDGAPSRTTVPNKESRLSSILAGAELGFYLFLGNSLQVVGLKTVPSDRAGFLIQLTTILVPLVQATLSGSLRSVSVRTWTACFIALLGIVVMGYDGSAVAPSLDALNVPAFSSGDVLVLSAAVVYSLHVVRLGRWANETAPLKLVAYKATTELILGLVVMYLLVSISASATVGGDPNGLFAFFQESGREIVSFFDALKERIATGTLPASSVQKAVGATLWTGLVSTAYTTYAQSYGQRRVKPADANLIYSLQPIFTAAFAYLLLGETMGEFGVLGGTLIGGAVYLAASDAFSSAREKDSVGKQKDTPAG